MSPAPRSSTVYSLEEAVGAAPVLAQLRERIALSQRCLNHVRPLIPITMRQQVKAGPIDGSQWCLLVGSAAASSKLRQLLPAIQSSLLQHGFDVTEIRVKIQTSEL